MEFYNKSLKIKIKLFGEDHVEVAEVLFETDVENNFYGGSDSNVENIFESVMEQDDCNSINLLLESCSNTNDGLKVIFNLENNPVDKLQFNLRDGDNYLFYQKSDYSEELQGISMTEKVGEGYVLQIEQSPDIDEVEITHPNCMTNYIYSKVSCFDNSEVQVGKKLKCGGYLQFKDRVLCRMSISDSEKDEFENKYPEECSNYNNDDDSDHCWKTYHVVEDCWNFNDRDERMSCVKQQLEINTIVDKKEACENDQCMIDLSSKVYDLVKFRIHNLEVEAEEMWKSGSLPLSSFISFLSKVEGAKLEFNQALDNSERKGILMDVRDYWIDLMRERLS